MMKGRRAGMILSTKCDCCVCEPVCKYKEVYKNGIEAILNATVSYDNSSFCKVRDCPHIDVSIKCPHMITQSEIFHKGR